VADEYRLLAGSAGMRTDNDTEVIADLIFGGLLNRLLATGEPPSRAIAKQVADIRSGRAAMAARPVASRSA